MNRPRRTTRNKEEIVNEPVEIAKKQKVKKVNSQNNTSVVKKKRGRPQKSEIEERPKKKQAKRKHDKEVVTEDNNEQEIVKTLELSQETTNPPGEVTTGNNRQITEEQEVEKTTTTFICKYCDKDFSSSFILCLHLRIHEKVENADKSGTEVLEEQSDKQAGVGVPGIINKNFVENLKKNLSLAMNKIVQ